MHIRPMRRAVAVVAGVAIVLGGGALASAAAGPAGHSGASTPIGIRHVLLISVDGMHQQDLTWYVRNFPRSTLATLDHRGTEYASAMTPFPSDSFPGMVG